MSKILIDEVVVRQALQVPLHELLAKVPADARLVIEDADGFGTSYIPVGRYCQEAATVIRQALVNEALDQMADNAKELGLTYEQPAQQESDHIEDVLAMVEQPAQQQEARIAQLEIELMKKQGRELKLQFAPAQQDIPDLIAGALGVSRGTAYDMMREALAEQSAQQEPVGYWQGKFSKDGGATLCRVPQVSFLGRHTYPNIPLYSTPPAPAQPLTDEEIQKLRHNIDWTASWSYIDFARAIEQAHGITKGGAA